MGKQDVIAVHLTGAQVHDVNVGKEMVYVLPVHGVQQLVADKGYDDDAFRDQLRSFGMYPQIPSRQNRKHKPFYDKTVYRWRYRIEMLFGRLKENRRLALRVDKLDVTFLGFLALGFLKFYVC